MQRAFDVVRAAAIALYVVFVVLALLAGHRGLRSGGALFVVTVVFALLVGTDWYEPGTKWFSCRAAGRGRRLRDDRACCMRRRHAIQRDPWGSSA